MHFSIDRTVHTTAFDKPVVCIYIYITGGKNVYSMCCPVCGMVSFERCPGQCHVSVGETVIK